MPAHYFAGIVIEPWRIAASCSSRLPAARGQLLCNMLFLEYASYRYTKGTKGTVYDMEIYICK